MRTALFLTILACVVASVALAQAPLPGSAPPPPPAGIAPPGPVPDAAGAAPEASTPAAPETFQPAVVDSQGARATPPAADSLDARAQRCLEEYKQRHEQRELELASYAEASGNDPSLERFTDPRKIQVELKDELDREQTSQQLAKDYADESREILGKEQAVEEFIAKRAKTLDDLSKQSGVSNRRDLEVAAANLAKLPGSPQVEALARDLNRRLAEMERVGKDLPERQTRAQQESAGAGEELAKLKELEQSYEKESKTYAADAQSAHTNRLALADRLEYYLVRAQAEDVLDQGRKATQSVHHLPASSEVEKTLSSPAPGSKQDVDPEKLKSCIQQTGDEKACREKAPQSQAAKE